MKERLVQLLDLEQLTPSKFADIIGVQRSSVSHVISGRNKPSFDFLQKTLKAFPGLNAEWLIMGKGTMYEQMGRSIPGNLFETPADTGKRTVPDGVPVISEDAYETADSQEISEIPKKKENQPQLEETSGESEKPAGMPGVAERRIVQVLVFYNDDTFSSYGPSQ